MILEPGIYVTNCPDHWGTYDNIDWSEPFTIVSYDAALHCYTVVTMRARVLRLWVSNDDVRRIDE